MKETWNKHRDTAMAVVFITFVAAISWEGGKELFAWAKLPFMVAIIVGIGFMVGNDGSHSVKRFLRDVAWPWIRKHLRW